MAKKQDWRKTRDYRVWRAKVIRRGKRCVICGAIHHRQAHHLDSGSYFPDERYDVNNGVTLCQKCHSQFHNNYKKSYRQKCTKYDFENFKQLVKYFKDTFCNNG